MRHRLVVVAALTASAAVAVPALAATRSVTVGDNFFVSKKGVPTVTVKRGDTVRFAFKGKKPHNVKVTRGPARFESPVKKSGSWSKRVTRKGTYRLVCTIHGADDQSMVLRVR